MQIPKEVKAHVLCETCFAGKQTEGVYEYQHLYLVDLFGAVTEYVYNSKGLLVEETNPLRGVTVYKYNAFNQLEMVTTPTGVCQVSFYDALGIRSAFVENGITTQYMTYNGVVLAAYNAAGERTEYYTYGNEILAWE